MLIIPSETAEGFLVYRDDPGRDGFRRVVAGGKAEDGAIDDFRVQAFFVGPQRPHCDGQVCGFHVQTREFEFSLGFRRTSTL
jgi:hypothetical protein